jgi:hypothetical protein
VAASGALLEGHEDGMEAIALHHPDAPVLIAEGDPAIIAETPSGDIEPAMVTDPHLGQAITSSPGIKSIFAL